MTERTVRMRKLSASPAGVFPAGSRRQVDKESAAHLIQTGQADPDESRPEPQPEPVQPSEQGRESEFPRHKGAGWYELSDGDTVRGEEEAIEAEAALHEE